MPNLCPLSLKGIPLNIQYQAKAPPTGGFEPGGFGFDPAEIQTVGEVEFGSRYGAMGPNENRPKRRGVRSSIFVPCVFFLLWCFPGETPRCLNGLAVKGANALPS